MHAKIFTLTPPTPLSGGGRGGKKSIILPSPQSAGGGGEGEYKNGMLPVGCAPPERYCGSATNICTGTQS